jgi:DNA-binding NarL/FixJ family response regulator
MSERIRVVVADDHKLLREGITFAVNAQPDMQVIGQAATANDAISLSCDLAPDIILLDLNMPGGGLLAAAMIAATCPSTRIVILTISSEEQDVHVARQIGAHGYILKGVRSYELIHMLHTIWTGGSVWPTTLTC